MGQATLVVLAALFVVGLLLKGWVVFLRRRGLARLGDEPRLVHARGVSVRAYVEGGRWRGLAPRRAYRTTADMAVTSKRFVLSSGRGIWVDRPAGSNEGLRARSTGPGRLVLEGEVQGNKATVLYRLELVVADANAWVRALGPFATCEGPVFTKGPPTRPS